MKVKKGKIVSATVGELMHYYLTRNWDDVMSFRQFVDSCKENGTEVKY